MRPVVPLPFPHLPGRLSFMMIYMTGLARSVRKCKRQINSFTYSHYDKNKKKWSRRTSFYVLSSEFINLLIGALWDDSL